MMRMSVGVANGELERAARARKARGVAEHAQRKSHAAPPSTQLKKGRKSGANSCSFGQEFRKFLAHRRPAANWPSVGQARLLRLIESNVGQRERECFPNGQFGERTGTPRGHSARGGYRHWRDYSDAVLPRFQF